jgi:hypothetical protein
MLVAPGRMIDCFLSIPEPPDAESLPVYRMVLKLACVKAGQNNLNFRQSFQVPFNATMHSHVVNEQVFKNSSHSRYAEILCSDPTLPQRTLRAFFPRRWRFGMKLHRNPLPFLLARTPFLSSHTQCPEGAFEGPRLSEIAACRWA